MLFDCFLTAQNFAKTGKILEQLDLMWLRLFSVETYRSKLCCVECFCTAFLLPRILPGLAKFWDVYVLEQLHLKWLRCFSVEIYRSKLCCVKCSLTAFWLPGILPGLAKFWLEAATVCQGRNMSKLCCVQCSLTAFWLPRILPGLAKFWDMYMC